MQRSFSIARAAAALLIAASVLAAHRAFIALPGRAELGPRPAVLRLDPLELDPASFAPLTPVAAWRVGSGDPRFGGISGLAIDRGALVALTDSGAVVRFAIPAARAPTAAATVRELPGGPGPAEHKASRDSEAIAADPNGRGWWVAFENRDELWLYDRSFSRPLRRLALARTGGRNQGIEGLAASSGALLLFPERGLRLFRLRGRTAVQLRLGGVGGAFPWDGWVAEAVALPGGGLLIAERRLVPAGFVNSLVELRRAGGGYAAARRYRLPLGPLANVEALAAEPRADGSTRLWLMTDNDFRRGQPTLLLALDLPAVRRPRPNPAASSRSRASAS